MDNDRVGGVMRSQAPSWLKTMRFIDLRILGIVRSRPQRRAEGFVTPYEPWVAEAIDRFEREMVAFCRRSQFSAVI
jgi:hypothetical protein